MDVRLRLTGVQEIDKVLKGLPLQVNHKLVQQANFQASKYLVNEAKLTAPEGPTGNTVDSIGTIRQSFAKSSELGLVQTGPRRGGKYKGHVAHLIEYGTKQRRLKSNGANRGTMPKRPFMEPAWERTKDKVLNSINGFLGAALYRFMKRTIKNG
jgi:HK97 gp10 family phage protein